MFITLAQHITLKFHIFDIAHNIQNCPNDSLQLTLCKTQTPVLYLEALKNVLINFDLNTLIYIFWKLSNSCNVKVTDKERVLLKHRGFRIINT